MPSLVKTNNSANIAKIHIKILATTFVGCFDLEIAALTFLFSCTLGRKMDAHQHNRNNINMKKPKDVNFSSLEPQEDKNSSKKNTTILDVLLFFKFVFNTLSPLDNFL